MLVVSASAGLKSKGAPVSRSYAASRCSPSVAVPNCVVALLNQITVASVSRYTSCVRFSDDAFGVLPGW